MNKVEKSQVIASLEEKFANKNVLYITDSSTLTVEQINKFRGMCFEKGIEFQVVKNKLAKIAFENVGEDKGFEPLFDALKGPSAILFAEDGNAPAKLLLEFRKEFDKPLLKAAYIESAVYFGDDQLKNLKNIKSKNELLADVIALLQSPIKQVVDHFSLVVIQFQDY
ncbi:MAG: 50S ribosomal protein L10 [Saprospiraceae bacterium]